MSTVKKLDVASNNVEDTLRLAEKIGRNLRGGEVIELRSDIGGGKTTFVRGLTSGAGSEDQVASPTFTISRIYSLPDGRRINHFDFHRLDDPGLMAAELGESVTDPHSVTIIEWAGIVEEVLPHDRLVVKISTTGELKRMFEIGFGEKHEHLVRGIKP